MNPHEKLIFLHKQEYPDGVCVYVYDNSSELYETARDDVNKAKVLYGHTSYCIHIWFGLQARYIPLVRNPIDLVISFYNHQLQHKNSLHYQEIHDGGLTLRDMLRSEISLQMNNHMVRIISGYPSAETTDDITILENAIANIEQHFAFVGLTERLRASVNILAQRLGWGRRYLIPRFNISPPLPEIDAATRAAIKEYNRLDLMLYEYVEKHFPPNPGLFTGLGRQV